MPSIVPDGQEPTVYLVLNDFGRYGRAYSETSEERADLETTITDLITGQYDRPVRVVAFNTAEGWSADVSEDIAREIMLVRFFMVTSNSLLSLPKRMGQVDDISKELHGKRIHRFTCRVRTPRGASAWSH